MEEKKKGLSFHSIQIKQLRKAVFIWGTFHTTITNRCQKNIRSKLCKQVLCYKVQEH